MIKQKLLLGLIGISCFALNELLANTILGDSVGKSPFFVDKIAVKAGGQLMLAPRLPNVEDLQPGEYVLKLNFPEGISLSKQRVLSNRSSWVDSIDETIKEFAEEGKKRIELSYRPNCADALDGMEFHLCYHINNGGPLYVPTIKFHGTFDWQIFRKEFQVPDGCDDVVPLFLKWPDNSTYSGILSFSYLRIIEVDTGRAVFNFHPEDPVVMKLEKGYAVYWLSEDPAKAGNSSTSSGDKIKLIPGKKYIIECQAKGDGINSVKNASYKKIPYTRTLIFDVDTQISLPGKLYWRIEGKDGKVYEKGELALVESPERAAPEIIDTSVWVCETDLQKESSEIQQLYTDKFYEWGLNTIEPEMHIPDYGTVLNEKTLLVPIIQKAKKMGMRARAYMRFLYGNNCTQSYLKANPQFAGIDPRGKKVTRAPVCPTHYLEKENPWLKYCLDGIGKSVKIHDLDGVFIDFEINAAPYVKCLPGNKELPPGKARQWRSPCICERCRKAFQVSIGLDHVPSVEECCGDALYEKWVDFRCRQNIELWQLIARTVKAENGNGTFSIYSGPPGNFSRQSYGVDWTMAAPYLDFAMLRDFCPFRTALAESFNIALKEGMPASKDSRKVLYQIQFFPYSDQWKWGLDENKVYAELANTRNNIVRTVAVCGSYGWSFCGIWGMDDQLTLPIKEANAILAKYEDYFVKGKKIDGLVKLVKGDVEIATWRLGEKEITFVFNMKARTQNVIISTPSGKKFEFDMKKYDCHICEW